MLTAEEITRLLKLEPLVGEGGMFRQSYRSTEVFHPGVLPGRYTDETRPYSTAIYYLLTNDPDSFSALHSLPTDEVYHFYLGSPVEMLLLYPDGDSLRVVLGQDIMNGQVVQFVAPAGVWQGSRLVEGGTFALLGTTMAPGYIDSDFTAGELAPLVTQYPARAELIKKLTRV
jgi:predicted cupin superfamily sugar epimerase